VLEELVGQIQDEFDQEQPMLAKVGDTVWDVLGTLPVHDLEQLVGVSLGEEGVTTTSGLVTQRLGGFAKPGDVLTVGGYELRVEEMEETRVSRLRLKRISEPEEPA